MKILRLFIATTTIIAALLGSSVIDARSRITTRRGLKIKADAMELAASRDTVAISPSDVVTSGYDKPQRSYRESAFFTNNTPHHIASMILRLTYTDSQSRVLHSVRRVVPCDIPAGTTRQLYWSSWDRQQSFRYRQSHATRYSTAATYNVTCAIDSIIVHRK